MTGKNYLVTGASDGIGLAVAQMLLDKGATVVLVARREDELMRTASIHPGRAYVYSYDLSDLDHIEDVFRFCREKGLKLDGMLHAAGVSHNIPVKSVDVDDMMDTFGVNYFAAVQLGRYFSLKKYSNEGASVVYMSSIAAERCDMGMSQYAASKAALDAFVKVLAKEVVRRKIRVNAIAPAAVDTGMTRDAIESISDYENELRENQPFGVIPVNQVVELIGFLFSDETSYMTGTILQITGGNI